jgi:major membrane immunogen (membrane-anchored lipoprotein)
VVKLVIKPKKVHPMLKRVTSFFTMVLVFSVLVSCSGGSYKITVGEIESTKSEIRGEYENFSGHYFKEVKLQEGESLTVTFSEQTEAGNIAAKVLDSSGELVDMVGTDEPLKISGPGKYTLQVEGEKHRGEFVLNWEIK